MWLGSPLVLIRRHRRMLRRLNHSAATPRWSLTSDDLAPLLTAAVEPMRYPALTLRSSHPQSHVPVAAHPHVPLKADRNQSNTCRNDRPAHPRPKLA